MRLSPQDRPLYSFLVSDCSSRRGDFVSKHNPSIEKSTGRIGIVYLEQHRAEKYCARLKGSQPHQTGGHGGSEVEYFVGHRLCRTAWLSTPSRSGAS